MAASEPPKRPVPYLWNVCVPYLWNACVPYLWNATACSIPMERNFPKTKPPCLYVDVPVHRKHTTH